VGRGAVDGLGLDAGVKVAKSIVGLQDFVGQGGEDD